MDREVGTDCKHRRTCCRTSLLVFVLMVALLSLTLSTVVFVDALYGGRLLRPRVAIEEHDVGRMLVEVSTAVTQSRSLASHRSPTTSTLTTTGQRGGRPLANPNTIR